MSPTAPPATPPPPTFQERFLRFVTRLARDTAVVVAGVLLLLVLGAGGFLWWLRQQRFEPGGVPAGHEVGFTAGVRPGVFYFAAQSGDSLVAVLRFLPDPVSLSEEARQIVHVLALGPGEGPLLRLLPRGTTVRHAFLDEEGRLYLDFEPGFERSFAGGSTAEYLALASLVRTMDANLPNVRSVSITAAGSPVSSLGGHFPLREELEVSEWW